MEVTTIDWNDSNFENDELYEHINAPQWIDLSANHSPLDHDDDWFCRPDCNHPKTADDFFVDTTLNHCKVKNSANVSLIPPPNDRIQSSFKNSEVKKSGTLVNKISKTIKRVEDMENQNPNFSTPTAHMKPNTENKKEDRSFTPRKLKSTFSARNLFAGNNILNHITEFCNELKRLASRKKERGDEHEEEEIVLKKQEVNVLLDREVQKKPLLETTKVKLAAKKRNGGLENSPIAENKKSTRQTPSKAFGRKPFEGHVGSLTTKHRSKELQAGT